MDVPQLPIVVSQDELKENPKFANLLSQLADKCLNEEGINYSLVQELGDTERNLFQAKQNYLQNAVVMDGVREMIDQKHTLRHKKQRIALARVDKIMQTAQSHQVLERMNPDFASDVHLLDISPSWLNETNQMDAMLNGMENIVRKYIFPELESRLQTKLESITQFIEPFESNLDDALESLMEEKGDAKNDNDAMNVLPSALNHSLLYFTPSKRTANNKNHQVSHDEILIQSSLTSSVRKHKILLREQKKLLRKQILKLQQDYWVYYKKIWQGLVVMNDMIRKFKLDYFSSFDKLTLDWLCTRVKTMHKKAIVMQYQYLTATYNSESIASLRYMRQTLDNELEDKTKRYRLIEYELAEYAKVGEGFDKLVEEYASVLKKIEEKQWQVKQLRLHGQLQEQEQRVARQQFGLDVVHEQAALHPQNTTLPSTDNRRLEPEKGRGDFSSSYDQQLRDLFADDDDDEPM